MRGSFLIALLLVLAITAVLTVRRTESAHKAAVQLGGSEGNAKIKAATDAVVKKMDKLNQDINAAAEDAMKHDD